MFSFLSIGNRPQKDQQHQQYKKQTLNQKKKTNFMKIQLRIHPENITEETN